MTARSRFATQARLGWSIGEKGSRVLSVLFLVSAATDRKQSSALEKFFSRCLKSRKMTEISKIVKAVRPLSDDLSTQLVNVNKNWNRLWKIAS